MTNWKEYRLGDIISVKHGYAFRGEFFSETPTNDLLLTPGNFYIGGGFKSGKLKYFKGEYPKEYILSEGDVIITMTDLSKEGDTLGYSAQIPAHNDIRYLHNQRIGLMQLKNQEFSREFLYWLLRTRTYQEFIVSSATGTTVRHTSPTRIYDYKFKAPNLETQIAIAEILSSLDNKIELINQINQNLEALAQALFKQWFVDFEFPDKKGNPYKSSGGKMVESELGEIPDGWRVGSIYDVSEVINGAAFKSALFNQEGKGLPLIRIRDLKTYRPQFWTNEKHPKGLVIKPGDLVVGMDAEFRPHMWLGQDAWLNQRVCHFKPKEGFSRLFIWETIRPQLMFFENSSVGTTVIHLGKGDIDTFKSKIPNKEVLKKFSDVTEYLLDKIVDNSKETEDLKKLRDLILPKLMSGELEVKKVKD